MKLTKLSKTLYGEQMSMRLVAFQWNSPLRFWYNTEWNAAHLWRQVLLFLSLMLMALLVTSPEDCSLAWAKLGSLKCVGNDKDWKPAGSLQSVPKTEIKPWGRLLGKAAQHTWRNGKNVLFRIISVATLWCWVWIKPGRANSLQSWRAFRFCYV